MPTLDLPTFKLTVAYDGSNYCGWQVQPRGLSVQGELERAIARVTRQRVRVTGSGRTDAGVHALGQVASCQIDTRLEPEQLGRAMNANLPRDIRVLHVAAAERHFHALREARGKTYRYLIQQGPIADPFLRSYAWFIPETLDLESMRQAAATLVGRHDFASFQTSGSPRATTVRHVTQLTVDTHPNPFGRVVQIEISADGFLYNMVRNVVGTLVEVGRGKQPVAWVASVRLGLDRRLAGPTAPPHGLYLVHVRYADAGPGAPTADGTPSRRCRE